MRLQKGQNPNRPAPGSRIKVEPIGQSAGYVRKPVTAELLVADP
jgi:hypothetical protein